MRLPYVVSSFCLPLALLTGCPGNDTGDEGAAPSTTNEDPTVADDTSTTAGNETDPPPPDTDTNPLPPDTDTDPLPPDTDTDPLPPDTDTDTDGRVTGCECIPDDVNEGGSNTPSNPTCGEEICPSVAGSCAGFCSDDPFALEDPAALECALIALRDRTPGRLQWRLSENGGQYDEDGYVLVNEDGTAARRDWGWNDLEYVVSDARLGMLLPPEHFDACLAQTDDLARFQCMRGPLTATQETCDEGWTYSKF